MRLVIHHHAITSTRWNNYCGISGASSKRELLRENAAMQAEQCLHRVRVFSATNHTPPRQWVGGGYTSSWEGYSCDSWPKGYSIPYDIMLGNKTRGNVRGEPLLQYSLGISQLVMSTCFHLHHLCFLGFSYLSVIFLFINIYYFCCCYYYNYFYYFI